MKNRFAYGFLGLVCLVVGSAIGAANARAEQIEVPERVFAPVGFDNNDNAQVVLYGHFADTCYQAGPAEAKILDHDILIRNVALHWDGGSCLKGPVPWATTVNLGALASGVYTVFVEGVNGKMIRFTSLEIFPSISPQTDDYRYAYVNGAIINRSKRLPILTLSGSFSLTCMEIAQIRMKETAGVIVVRPIVRLRNDVPCGHPFAPIPFTARVQLHPKTERATLVHIRSVNGQALNQVLDY